MSSIFYIYFFNFQIILILRIYLNLSVTVKGKILFYLQNYFIPNKRYDMIKKNYNMIKWYD